MLNAARVDCCEILACRIISALRVKVMVAEIWYLHGVQEITTMKVSAVGACFISHGASPGVRAARAVQVLLSTQGFPPFDVVCSRIPSENPSLKADCTNRRNRAFSPTNLARSVASSGEAGRW